MHGRRTFRVRVGVRHGLGWTGTRQFGTRSEAVTFIAAEMQRRKQLGEAAANLPPARLLEAAACMPRLAAVGATLTEAVDFFLANSPTVCSRRTVTQLGDEFLASRRSRGCKQTTLSEYKSKIGAIQAEFGKASAHEVLTAEIEDWLEELDVEARTKLGYLKSAMTLWNFGMKRSYVLKNPAKAIDPPICDDRPPGILRPEELAVLLKVAHHEGGTMVRSIAVAAFAGVRRSEVFVLDEVSIDSLARLIEILGAHAKTRRRRLVPIDNTLAAWLHAFPPAGSRIIPYQHIDVFGQELNRLAKLAGITPWPHNALRHSFGTYHLAAHKNENLTASIMGNSPGVVVRHYREVVRPAVATAYWELTPETVLT